MPAAGEHKSTATIGNGFTAVGEVVDSDAQAGKSEALIIEQIYLPCLSQASYLVADKNTRIAAVVDPRRDVGIYEEAASRLGVKIKHILLTHIHADFVAGHLELQARTGAPIYMGKQATTSFPFTPLADGDTIHLGQVRLSVLETPGHTVESICLVAYDATKGERPQAVLTGDTLFVGDVGRPDLLASQGIESKQLAALLFESLGKLAALPDETVVYPGHGEGSPCGKRLGIETCSTIGRQRKFNYALKARGKDEFFQSVCSDLDEPPAYFSCAVNLNKTDRPLIEHDINRGMLQITCSELLHQRDLGAQLLDVRMSDQFARGHIDQAINVALSGTFARWAGIVLRNDAPIYVLCTAGQEHEALMRLARIGLCASGYFPYPSDPTEIAATCLRSYRRVSPDRLDELTDTEPHTVLDVRDPAEFKGQHLPGSVNIPLARLAFEDHSLSKELPIIVYCQAGYLSTIGVSLLLNQGYENVSELIGGIAECFIA